MVPKGLPVCVKVLFLQGLVLVAISMNWFVEHFIEQETTTSPEHSENWDVGKCHFFRFLVWH